VIALTARPRLASKVRLRRDRFTGRDLLLYPERGLALNATASAVVALCSGDLTVAAIADRVAAGRRPPARADVVDDVRAFLTALAERGVVVAD
jgi:coenzyme PQQ biosynthesis protein PqqD